MKTILIPIYKKHNINIFDTLLKTEEIRKVKPKIDLPFKVVVYEPLGKKHKYNGKYCKTQNCNDCNGEGCYEGCGKVVGEFFVDRIEAIKTDMLYSTAEKACITKEELFNYLGVIPNSNFNDYNWGYAWHITAPKRYDKPKELCDYKTVRFVRGYHKKNETMIERLQNSKRVEVTYVSKAPQNYMRIEEV